MTRVEIVVGVSALYLVASLVIGMLPGKKLSETADGYVAGDRSLGPLVMYFITGATIFSAFAFLGAPGWAYSKGAAVFYILAYGTLGFLPFYFMGPRAARLGRHYGFVTQAQLVASRFRFPLIAALMALISALAFIPYLAIQMMGAGYVLSSITEGALPSWAGAAVVYAVVLIYVMRSGVLGVGWTNTFQGIFMMVLAWVLGILLPYELYGGIGPMFERLAAERPEMLTAPGLEKLGGGPWPWGMYTSTVLVTTIGFSFWPHLFMKAYTARDERTLRRTVLLYPSFQLFLVPLMLIGFAGILHINQVEHADQILPTILMSLENLHPVVIGLFCAGALAASMSSGDAILHATASILVRDGLVTGLGKKLTPAVELRLIRSMLFVVVIAAYVITLTYSESIVGLLNHAYGPVTQFAPAVLAALYWRKATGAGVLAGLAVGISANLILTLNPDWAPWRLHSGVYGLALNVATLTLVSKLTAAAPSAEDDEFFNVASKPLD
jgi:solute:Na+ symporter, SSS family